jgi:hypothetical protein
MNSDVTSLDPASTLPTSILTGWAALSDTARWPGPTSGQFLGANALGVTRPFVGQPIPGFSALLKNPDGTWTAMPDNGFGAKSNSGDFSIGFYNASIDFRTNGNGTSTPGTIKLNNFVSFNDANGLLKDGKGVDLKITADFTNYQTLDGNNLKDSGIPVDARIRSGRLLTGFDFDVESIARAKDGSYFVGEEFGPYILHFSSTGTLLNDPIPHPFLKSPANPEVLNNGATVTSRGSRGFESLAFNSDKTKLYAVPEAAPAVATFQPVPGDERFLNFFEFDPATMKYTGNNLVYKKDGDAVGNVIVIGDMTNVGGSKYVLIERDNITGITAKVKRVYLVDFNDKGADGVLNKKLLVNLLDISDPRDIGGPLPGLAPNKFNFPFDSVESIVVLDSNTLAVAIDTNYPDQDGRVIGKPDNTEVITIRFDDPLFAEAFPTPIVSGTVANDVLVGGKDFNGGENIIFAGGGNDEVDTPAAGAFAGSNNVFLGSGNDIIFVANGDRVSGGTGNDEFEASDASGYRMSGGAGDDIFFLGQSGRALGGDGNDKFFAGTGGSNLLSGGAGADQFWIANAEIPSAANTILDFQVGTDVIGIQGAKSLGISATTLVLNQVGADTAINFGGQTLAVLTGIQATSLTLGNPSQFVFA